MRPRELGTCRMRILIAEDDPVLAEGLMLAINIFVLPIAFGGLLRFPDGSVDADTFVLTLPMAEKHELLALLVFIGGLSAATGMIIVDRAIVSTITMPVAAEKPPR